jgi:hypothetical protein
MASNEMSAEQALRGFPLSERERVALVQFYGEVATPQKGVGRLTLGNLLQRKWIEYQGIDDRHYPVYLTTAEGVNAIKIDDIALELGFERPLPTQPIARRVSYRNLEERLEFLLGIRPTGPQGRDVRKQPRS